MRWAFRIRSRTEESINTMAEEDSRMMSTTGLCFADHSSYIISPESGSMLRMYSSNVDNRSQLMVRICHGRIVRCHGKWSE